MSETEKGCTGMRNAMPGPQNLKESDSGKLLVHQGKYDSGYPHSSFYILIL